MRSPVSGSLSEGIQFCTACLSPRRGEVSRSDGEGPPCLPLRGRWFRAARSPEPEGVVPFSRRGRRPRRLAKSLPRARGRWPRSAVIANQCSHWCGNPSILPRDEGVPFFCLSKRKGPKKTTPGRGRFRFLPLPGPSLIQTTKRGLRAPFGFPRGCRFPPSGCRIKLSLSTGGRGPLVLASPFGGVVPGCTQHGTGRGCRAMDSIVPGQMGQGTGFCPVLSTTPCIQHKNTSFHQEILPAGIHS